MKSLQAEKFEWGVLFWAKSETFQYGISYMQNKVIVDR